MRVFSTFKSRVKELDGRCMNVGCMLRSNEKKLLSKREAPQCRCKRCKARFTLQSERYYQSCESGHRRRAVIDPTKSRAPRSFVAVDNV